MTIPYKLIHINDQLPAVIDVFIASASYEKRCLSVPQNMDRNRVGIALIAENVDYHEYVDSNNQLLHDMFGPHTIGVNLDTRNPLLCLASFSDALKAVQKEQPQVFVVDITAFTREALLILLRLLSYNAKESDAFYFLYNGAAEYSLGLNEGDKWLSKGIRDIRSVLGYPGEVLPSRRTHLVVMLGFESERAGELIERFEPALLSLGYGSEGSSITHSHYKTNRIFFERLFNEKVETQYRGSLEHFQFPPDDPVGTALAISKQAALHPDHNMILAAMNTKLSTLGVALAAFQHEEFQLCYAEAEFYNIENYSSPSDTFYMFTPVNFGSA